VVRRSRRCRRRSHCLLAHRAPRGGLERPDQSSDAVAREAAAFEQIPERQREFRLIAIARANPDAQSLQFPPSGVAYREHVESHVLWRWVGTHAPDLVLIAGPDPGLVDALSQNLVLDVGRIPARRVDVSTRLLQSITAGITVSSAHQELDRRIARSPRALAEELARVYGRQFTEPTYIAAMALVSRLRLGERDESRSCWRPTSMAKDSFAKPSQSSLAAHLAVLRVRAPAGDDRAKALVLRAAASGFTENGELREFMPLHGGWSDSLFMDVPILAMAGASPASGVTSTWRPVTSRSCSRSCAGRTVSIATRRPTNAAWGRGNAFPALGLALTLSEFPKEHPTIPSADDVPHSTCGARALPGRERDVAQRHRSPWRVSGILRHCDDCHRRCCAASETDGSIARRTNR
jgi:hypothetical protein